jgi:hypothetical protein
VYIHVCACEIVKGPITFESYRSRTGHSLHERLFDYHNPHFGRLKIRFLNPENPGVGGIVNIFVGDNSDTFRSADTVRQKRAYTIVVPRHIPNRLESTLDPFLHLGYSLDPTSFQP